MEKFRYKKSLGQNFLKDENILKRIKDSVLVKENDLVIEIGPGSGALTKYLKEYKADLKCFEIDERVKPYLDKLKDDKTEIIYQDFLQVNIKDYIDKDYANIYVIANLPYYITTPIIKRIIDSGIKIKQMVLMVQEEVADRFTALPGNKSYGSITVYLNYYFKVQKLFRVSRSFFEPVPNVDSAVISLEALDTPYDIKDPAKFFKLVNDAFRLKRKTLKNNLKDYDFEKVLAVLMEHNLGVNTRAEELSIDIFIEIANRIF